MGTTNNPQHRTDTRGAVEQPPVNNAFGQPGKLLRRLQKFFSGDAALGDQAAAFEAYCARQLVSFCRIALLVLAGLMVLIAPTDQVLFAHEPVLLQRLRWWRLFAFTSSLFGVWLLGRTDQLRIKARTLVLLLFFGVITSSAWSIAEMGGPEALLIINLVYAPIATVFMLLPFRTRLSVNLWGFVAVFLAYFGLHPAYIKYPFATSGCATILSFVVASSVAGHWVYRMARTNFLQKVEAQQTAARLRELDRLKDSFLATISHELRTPLNAVIGLSEVVMADPKAPEVPRYARTIHDSSEVLLGLINDLLDLAKVKSGRLELQSEPVSIPALVETSTRFFAVASQQKGLELTANVPSDLPPMLADPGRLKQVLLNLIGNAVKFTDEGTVRVDVALEESSLVVRVADTGVGIPDEQKEAIFDEFTQVDRSATRRYSGTGLGLPIVRRLSRLMGGDVTVSSNDPRGSVFTVRLPFVAAPEDATPKAPLSVTASDARVVSTSSPEGLRALESLASPAPTLRVLVADDVPENRLLLRLFLQKEGCDVAFAENGAKALERFRAERFDLAFLDIEMPVMDGYTAVAKMRQWERDHGRAPTPIIAVTAHGLPEHHQRSGEAGFTQHLSKPLRMKDIAQVIARFREKQAWQGVVPGAMASPEEIELQRTFIKRSRANLKSAQEWLAVHEFDQLRRLGHQWSGTAGMFGNEPLAEVGRALEAGAQTGDHARIGQLLVEAEKILARSPTSSGKRLALKSPPAER